MVIFRFLKMAAAAILDFFLQFLMVGTVKSKEPRHYAKLYRNRSNRGRYIAIFGFFKMAAAIILDFKIFNAKTVEPLHCAKFRLNHPGRHVVIIFIIQDGGRRHL